MEENEKDWEKFYYKSPKEIFDDKISKLYQNASTTEVQCVIGTINFLVNELLENIKKEQNENNTQI